MRGKNLPVQITSIALVVIGVALLAINIFTGGAMNVALPLVFLVLGGAFFIVVFSLRRKWAWSSFLYIPAVLLATFGVIFLLNVLTGDWSAWAYAWLLLLAAIGIGMLLTNREHFWHRSFNPLGWGLALGGITFFAVFGVIAGGKFIQIMAPILLVTAGLSLRWLRLESILPGSLMKKPDPPGTAADQSEIKAKPPVEEEGLVESLSSRELEVLRLIDSGLSNQQIADRLSVAQSTVKTHINNIYGKLGVQTRVQAVNRARGLRLFED